MVNIRCKPCKMEWFCLLSSVLYVMCKTHYKGHGTHQITTFQISLKPINSGPFANCEWCGRSNRLKNKAQQSPHNGRVDLLSSSANPTRKPPNQFPSQSRGAAGSPGWLRTSLDVQTGDGQTSSLRCTESLSKKSRS